MRSSSECIAVRQLYAPTQVLSWVEDPYSKTGTNHVGETALSTAGTRFTQRLKVGPGLWPCVSAYLGSADSTFPGDCLPLFLGLFKPTSPSSILSPQHPPHQQPPHFKMASGAQQNYYELYRRSRYIAPLLLCYHSNHRLANLTERWIASAPP